MTIELQQHLQREMEDALAIDNPTQKQDAIRTVLIHQNDALVDCQRKTAERVKSIVADLPAMKNDIKDIKDTIAKGKTTIRRIAFEAVKYIIIGGGGVEFARYLLSNSHIIH